MKSVIIPVLFSLALVGVLASGVNKIYNNTNDEPDTITNNRGSSGMSGDITVSTASPDVEELPAGEAAESPDPELEKIVVIPPPVQDVGETDEEVLITIQYSALNVAKIREIQRLLGIEVDGRVGKATLDAMILKLGGKIPAKPAKAAKVTLRKLPTAREVRSNRSIYGVAGRVPMAIVNLPYPMRYGSKTINEIGVHYLIADRVELALKRTLAHYGYERIKELNLDVYNGCFNYRRVRRGSLMSMHAWAVALDFDAAHNGLGVPTSRAAFARPEYRGWREAWESVGAVFYGKQRGHDWMQIQFVR